MSHFVTYQPLRKLSLRSLALPASSREIGSPMDASSEQGKREPETGSSDSVPCSLNMPPFCPVFSGCGGAVAGKSDCVHETAGLV
jgi:hypothetical protein